MVDERCGEDAGNLSGMLSADGQVHTLVVEPTS
jgi:hypothetical protein